MYLWVSQRQICVHARRAAGRACRGPAPPLLALYLHPALLSLWTWSQAACPPARGIISLALAIQAQEDKPGFSIDARDSNSDLHICKASALTHWAFSPALVYFKVYNKILFQLQSSQVFWKKFKSNSFMTGMTQYLLYIKLARNVHIPYTHKQDSLQLY